jgi:hypothetical protein
MIVFLEIPTNRIVPRIVWVINASRLAGYRSVKRDFGQKSLKMDGASPFWIVLAENNRAPQTRSNAPAIRVVAEIFDRERRLPAEVTQGWRREPVADCNCLLELCTEHNAPPNPQRFKTLPRRFDRARRLPTDREGESYFFFFLPDSFSLRLA